MINNRIHKNRTISKKILRNNTLLKKQKLKTFKMNR